MKRPVVILAALALGVVAVSVAACRPPRDRTDWRAPVTSHPCKSDSDCPAGSTCAIELGASQGICGDPDGGGYGYPYGPRSTDPHGDGGPGPHRPPGPPINVQPQPGDINI